MRCAAIRLARAEQRKQWARSRGSHTDSAALRVVCRSLIPMRLTLDTNVLGPISAPDLYPGAPQAASIAAIREHIQSGRVRAFVSEASLSLEALAHPDRIDLFIRAWMEQKYPIALPPVPPQRKEVFSEALKLGVKVLRVPRVALGSFFELNDDDWAEEQVFDHRTRSDRQSKFVRAFPGLGSSALKKLGAELVDEHRLDKSAYLGVASTPRMPSASAMMWMKGLVAEFDHPMRFSSRKKYVSHVRDVIADWCDLDILASHYAYGNDVFCTLDAGRGSGTGSLLHTLNRPQFAAQFSLTILDPDELLRKIERRLNTSPQTGLT
jgi:hypothetical protein